MKTAKNRGNGQFFVMLPKHVSGLTRLINHPGTLKLCAIAHENRQKMAKTIKFLVMPLKHLSGLTCLVKSPGTLKLWAIAHENDKKSRKRRVFGHAL